MADTYDRFVFPEPWCDLRGHGPREGDQRELLVRRLISEVGAGHELASRRIEPVAAFTRQDEVLYRLDGGAQFLFAHLTYTSAPPDSFIRLRFFGSWEDAVAMIIEMAEVW